MTVFMNVLLKFLLVVCAFSTPFYSHSMMEEGDEKKERQDYGPSDEIYGVPSQQEKAMYERTSRPQKTKHNQEQITNYRKVAKYSKKQAEAKIEEYTGTRDNWKNNWRWFSTKITKIRNYFGYEKKTINIPKADVYSLIVSQKNNPYALHEAFMYLRNFGDNTLRPLAIELQGERRGGFDNYKSTGGNPDLRGFLVFFMNLEEGDLGYNEKYFFEFELAIDGLKNKLRGAAEAALRTHLPILIEFESSALSFKQAPFISSFFNIVEKRSLKMEKTRSGGIIVSIHPYYAKILSDVFTAMSNQAIGKLKTHRGQYYTNPQSKKELIELAKNAVGFQTQDFEAKLFEVESGTSLPQLVKGAPVCSNFFN